jgi:hypothetical protein
LAKNNNQQYGDYDEEFELIDKEKRQLLKKRRADFYYTDRM